MVFLFTDIAGAVDLKARLGDTEAARIILRHDELFRRAISYAADGKIAQDFGDGFLAEFATASDAVQTALRFQHDIHTEPWGDEPIGVRTGIHLGEVVGGERKLIGLAKDIAARLMGMAIPGQILVSRAAFEPARQYVRKHPGIDSADPSPKLRWMDHGPYLFKGAEEPMDVFEVGAEGIAPLQAPPESEKAKPANIKSPKVDPGPTPPGQRRRACIKRLAAVLISLAHGPEKLGLRPEAVDAMKAQAEPLGKVYQLLVERTGIESPEISGLLKSLS